MDIENIEKQLIAFSNKHQLKEKALAFCDELLKVAEEENELNGYLYDELEIQYAKQEFIYNIASDSFINKPFIRTRISIFYNDGLLKDWYNSIGYFDFDTNLDGEYQEDWLFIKREKYDPLCIESELTYLIEYIPNNYLDRDSDNYEYISLFFKIISLFQNDEYYLCQKSIIKVFEYDSCFVDESLEYFHSSSKELLRKIACRMQHKNLIDPRCEIRMIELRIIPYKK